MAIRRAEHIWIDDWRRGEARGGLATMPGDGCRAIRRYPPRGTSRHSARRSIRWSLRVRLGGRPRRRRSARSSAGCGRQGRPTASATWRGGRGDGVGARPGPDRRGRGRRGSVRSSTDITTSRSRRSGPSWRPVSSASASLFALLFAMGGRFGAAAGVLGLCGMTAGLYALLRAGMRREARRVRQGSRAGPRRQARRLADAARGGRGCGSLSCWRWDGLAGWIALGLVAAIFAVGFLVALDVPIDRDREGPLGEARDLLAGLRARGVSESGAPRVRVQVRRGSAGTSCMRPSSASKRLAAPAPPGPTPAHVASAPATGVSPSSTGSMPGSATAARPGHGRCSSRSRSRRWWPRRSTR